MVPHRKAITSDLEAVKFYLAARGRDNDQARDMPTICSSVVCEVFFPSPINIRGVAVPVLHQRSELHQYTVDQDEIDFRPEHSEQLDHVVDRRRQ